MDHPINVMAAERRSKILSFYMIIFGVIIGFLTTEALIEEYVLHYNLTFFEHMIPSGILYGVLFVIILYFTQKTNMSYADLGFHGRYAGKALVIGFLATSGFIIAVVAFQKPLFFTSFVDILIIFCFSLLIGLTEEAAFRGYIQGSYMKITSQMKAIFLTGILFAFLHVPSYLISGNLFQLISLPSLVLVGLILGFIRVHTGNIWAVIIAHATWDFYIFIFIPSIDLGSIPEMIFALAASGAMWGTILLSMFVAKNWVDRPDQIPKELVHAYTLKINGLLDHIWNLQQTINAMQVSGMPLFPMITRYSSRIKMDEGFIKIYKEYLPQINESNYKIIQKLVPFKTKLVKIEHYLILGGPPPRIAELEMRKKALEAQIRELEIGLKGTNYL
ncbi:MAG: CPBP family intramembrane metalloprotease [Candidatus Helarchaeota archaeon]|nr:CPBP family intramembrane metalloprotease [Candidatus Helarchaeota archaeon]